ncbi:MAG: cation transporter [Acidimicrobiia bacterium]|nr:cation transporter [Acidimicrobiia bacterium]
MTMLSDDHDPLLERGRRLQIATIAWNLMEVFVTIGLGLAAGSLALIAFGLDSIVEVFASMVAIWYIADHHRSGRSTRALRLVSVAFVVLGIYLFTSSAIALWSRDVAESSPFGIAYLALTAGVMFGLARLKRVTALAAASPPLRAEASMTFLDGCLAGGILVALAGNSLFGWWWADPGAAILVGIACIAEAVDTWRTGSTERPVEG